MEDSKNMEFNRIFTEKVPSQKNDREWIEDYEKMIYTYKETHIDMLFGKEPEYIMDQLLNNTPTEEGGLVAIYGFYYQMLVFIEYMIEALQGKWSFLSVEYHDDIIAGNQDENKVRFIQVKTSKNPALSITHSSVHVYNRTISKLEGPSKGKLRNNSWLDKIIDNAAIVKELKSKVEFDLVTDYSIYNSERIEIDLYNDEKRGQPVKDTDHIYNRLKVNSYDNEGNQIDYEKKYGEPLNKLLGNVNFTEKPKVDFYLGSICLALSKTLGEGIRIEEEDINWLIGELISRCSKRESGPILFMSIEDIEEIRQRLTVKAVTKARPTIYKLDATELLDKCIRSILLKVSNNTLKAQIEVLMKEYKDLLLQSITERDSLQSYIKRFIDGEKPKFGDTNDDYHEDLVTFVTTSFLLYLIHDQFIFSNKHKTLLVKDAITNSFEQSKIGFLNLGLELDEFEGLDLLKRIIDKSSEEEQLELLWRNHSFYTIFHGDSISSMNSKIVELDSSRKPKVEQLEGALKSNEVTAVMTIIPELQLKELYTKIRRTDDIKEFRDLIIEKWRKVTEE